MAESQHALRRFERRPHALTWVAGLLTALAVLLLLGATTPAVQTASAASNAGAGALGPGAPRNFEIGRRTATTISLSWMRARGGRKPHAYLVFVDHRLRVRTRRKAVVLRGLRCGHRYRIWLSTRDRRGTLSKRHKRWVRTRACRSGGGSHPVGGNASPSSPRTAAGEPRDIASGAGSGAGSGVIATSAGAGGLGAQLPPRLPVSTGATFYVATDGSDSNPGTLGAPWRTVQKAMSTLTAGQTAMVRAGTYAQNLAMTRAGTAAAPITIRNYPGERPVLHPATSSPSWPLRLTTGAAYVRIQGFVIEQAQGAKTMNVVGLGSNPGAHDWEITDCEIRNAQNSSGMFVDRTNRNVWIIGNTVHDNNEPGVQHQGIYLESDDSVIANNVVYNQTNGFGIQVRTDGASGPNNVLVANNTVSDVSMAGIVLEHTASNARIVNNISAFNGQSGILGYYSTEDHADDPIGSGNVAYNNLLYGNTTGARSDRAGIIDFSAANIDADPMFASRGVADYTLTAGSPAVDAAVPGFAPVQDRLFVLRPEGAGPDIGAYERP